MAVQDYLAPGEQVLAVHGDYYATDRRVIKYKKDFLGEEWHDLSYGYIASLSMVSQPRAWLLWLGALLLLVGIVLGTLLSGLLFILIPAGIGLGALGALLKEAWFRLGVPALAGEEGEMDWRLPSPRAESARKLIQVVHLYRGASSRA